LIFPLCLRWQTGDWLRRNRWWKWAGLAVFALAAMLLVISPARPLWPATTVLSKFDAKSHPALERAASVYTIYAERPYAFAPVIEKLPADANPLGLIAIDYPETSLWKPFGSRRVLHVLPGETAAEASARGIRYVLVSAETLDSHTRETVAQWVARNHAEVVWIMPLRLRASSAATDWTLARLPADATKGL
jgi:hypothetical protein